MLLYIFLELPAIQLFAVHRKRSEANFIRRYHLVMFVLTLFCVTFQVLVHSSHRYGTLYSEPRPSGGGGEAKAAHAPKRHPSAEKLRHDAATAAARPPSPALSVTAPSAPSSRPASPSPATSAAAPPAAAPQRLAPPAMSAAHRGVSSPALKRSFS